LESLFSLHSQSFYFLFLPHSSLPISSFTLYFLLSSFYPDEGATCPKSLSLHILHRFLLQLTPPHPLQGKSVSL
jgi:hypothetical protein